MEYPLNCIWFIEAFDSEGNSVQQGSAVAVRIKKKDEQQALTYLLTCRHVIFDEDGNGSLFPTIKAFKPFSGYNSSKGKVVRIVDHVTPTPDELGGVNVREDGSYDWVLLSFEDNDLANAVKSVESLLLDKTSGEVRIFGFMGGGQSFDDDIVSPRRPNETFNIESNDTGEISLTGTGTRPGLSGGGVFTLDKNQLIGIHRLRTDSTAKLKGVSIDHIHRILKEKGFEFVIDETAIAQVPAMQAFATGFETNQPVVDVEEISADQLLNEGKEVFMKWASQLFSKHEALRKFVASSNELAERTSSDELAKTLFDDDDSMPMDFLRVCVRFRPQLSEAEFGEISIGMYRLSSLLAPYSLGSEDFVAVKCNETGTYTIHAKNDMATVLAGASLRGLAARIELNEQFDPLENLDSIGLIPATPLLGMQSDFEKDFENLKKSLVQQFGTNPNDEKELKTKLRNEAKFENIHYCVKFFERVEVEFLRKIRKEFPELVLLVTKNQGKGSAHNTMDHLKLIAKVFFPDKKLWPTNEDS